MHPREIKEYIKLLEKTDVSELEVQEGNVRLRIVRAIGGSANMSGSPLIVSHLPSTEMNTIIASPAAEKPAEVINGNIVTSPFVGTFYRAASPSSPAFVEMGSIVKKGQTLCIIEAMKLMNEIESDFEGKVVQIYVENGQPVEYGDKLLLIEKA